LIRCRAIGAVQFVAHCRRVGIDQIDFHCGGAPTPSSPLKVRGELLMQATLRAIFEQDPATRRQQGRRDRATHGLEMLA
jgi:hypothetical protein